MSKLDRNEKELLLKIAEYLVKRKEFGLASKIYNQLNEMKKLLQMHIASQHWSDVSERVCGMERVLSSFLVLSRLLRDSFQAFAIVQRYQGLSDYAYIEYGRWLSENDRFEEAHKAFHKAQADKEAYAVLLSLSENSITEARFRDAAYFLWILSKQLSERYERIANEKSLKVPGQREKETRESWRSL